MLLFSLCRRRRRRRCLPTRRSIRLLSLSVYLSGERCCHSDALASSLSQASTRCKGAQVQLRGEVCARALACGGRKQAAAILCARSLSLYPSNLSLRQRRRRRRLRLDCGRARPSLSSVCVRTVSDYMRRWRRRGVASDREEIEREREMPMQLSVRRAISLALSSSLRLPANARLLPPASKTSDSARSAVLDR